METVFARLKANAAPRNDTCFRNDFIVTSSAILSGFFTGKAEAIVIRAKFRSISLGGGSLHEDPTDGPRERAGKRMVREIY